MPDLVLFVAQLVRAVWDELPVCPKPIAAPWSWTLLHRSSLTIDFSRSTEGDVTWRAHLELRGNGWIELTDP